MALDRWHRYLHPDQPTEFGWLLFVLAPGLALRDALAREAEGADEQRVADAFGLWLLRREILRCVEADPEATAFVRWAIRIHPRRRLITGVAAQELRRLAFDPLRCQKLTTGVLGLGASAYILKGMTAHAVKYVIDANRLVTGDGEKVRAAMIRELRRLLHASKTEGGRGMSFF